MNVEENDGKYIVDRLQSLRKIFSDITVALKIGRYKAFLDIYQVCKKAEAGDIENDKSHSELIASYLLHTLHRDGVVTQDEINKYNFLILEHLHEALKIFSFHSTDVGGDIDNSSLSEDPT